MDSQVNASLKGTFSNKLVKGCQMHSQFNLQVPGVTKYNIFVIYRPGGPYQEKLCPRSRMYGPRPQAEVCAFQTKGKVFLDTDWPRSGNNIFFPWNLLESNFWLYYWHIACTVAFIAGFANDTCNKTKTKSIQTPVTDWTWKLAFILKTSTKCSL